MALSLNFYEIIEKDGNRSESMLNDLHIFEFAKFIPHLNIQPTIFLSSLNNIVPFQINEEFIQILFRGPNDSGHWICVWYDKHILRIYDSLNEGLHHDHKLYINRLFPNSDNIKIVYKKVQIQHQSYNCGLFAIAFATCIAFGICPCNVKFDEFKMRNHLKSMFLENKISMFPILLNYNLSFKCGDEPIMVRNNSQYIHFGLQFEQIIDLKEYSNAHNLSQNMTNNTEKNISCIDLKSSNFITSKYTLSCLNNKNEKHLLSYSDDINMRSEVSYEFKTFPPNELISNNNLMTQMKIKDSNSFNSARKRKFENDNDIELNHQTISKINSEPLFISSLTYESNTQLKIRNLNDTSDITNQNLLPFLTLNDIKNSIHLKKKVYIEFTSSKKLKTKLKTKLKKNVNKFTKSYNLKNLNQSEKLINFHQNQNPNSTILNSVHEFTYNNIGLIANSNYDDKLYDYNYLGEMDMMCEFCNAKHFALELPADKKFNNCCHKGKVLLNEFRYPTQLLNLTNKKTHESRQFINVIRNYNNALAFASFGAKLDVVSGQGPKVFRICGQIYHNAYALHPSENEDRKYGQLYIIDTEVASQIRESNHLKCSTIILKEIDIILREINPYAAAYKMMHEVEEEERNRALNNKESPQEVTMFITRKNHVNDKTYELPSCNEITVVFVGNESEPPFYRDFCVYSNSCKPQRIPIISKHVDPMIYPLIFPFGESG